MVDGEKKLCTSYLLLNSFNGGTMVSDGWKPYLVFEYIITSHKFNPTMYKISDVSHREKLHNTIMKLHNRGWGYTRIHKYLLKNDYKVSKHRTSIDIMIKKIKKRQEFLNQSIYESGFKDFRVEIMEVN